MALSKEQLQSMYHQMVRIRLFEQGLPEYFSKGLIAGTGHSSLGEEALSVGAMNAMGPKDFTMSTHRAHGHALARGADMKIILAELFTRATGCTGGRGGSMHIHDFDRYFFGTCGIVGGGITTAGGLGLAAKLKNSGQVSIGFFGDGASNRGTFHESLNMASLWKLPVVYICTNNQWAMTLPLCMNCANQDIAARGAAYDMPAVSIDGTDLWTVYDTAKEAIERARRGEGPSLIVAITYRLSPEHSMRASTDPSTAYRPKGEVEQWWELHDPVKITRRKLMEIGYLDEKTATQIEAKAKKEFDEALEFAMNSPEPALEAAFDGIYAPEEGGSR